MNTSTRRQFLQAVTAAGFLSPLAGRATNLAKHNKTQARLHPLGNGTADDYLRDLKQALTREWPNNKTINLVFHGHSVPSGYFKTPAVNTLAAYPHLLLVKLKMHYPNAVINCITTSIGGEQSQQGAQRINSVLMQQPDVLFIDYALNDRGIGLEAAKKAWIEMIKKVLAANVKLVLLTPSPDLKENILQPGTALEKHRDQIAELAKEYKVALADSYGAFRKMASTGADLNHYMAQFNHPNENGHEVIAETLLKYFI